MRLDPKALGLTGGILWGLTVFLTTIWILLIGNAGETLSKLGVIYMGYSVSWGGAAIGLVYGFIDGFIGGFLTAVIYNYFLPKSSAGG